jgi:TPP-dependent 2-oxoacid decarboxylase
MKGTVYACLFICLSLIAFAGEKDKGKVEDKTKQVYTYSAQIQDANNSEIISGANIILEDGTNISTDFDGVFKFKFQNSQAIKVKINAIGYQITEIEISPLTLGLPTISLLPL